MTTKKNTVSFILSLLLMMLAQLSTDIYLPSLPKISADWHVSIAFSKLTITSIIIALGVSQLYFGALSDYLGRKPVIIFGLAVFISGSVISVLARDIYSLIIARIVQGIGLGFGLSISSAVAGDLYQGKNCTNHLVSFLSFTLLCLY